MRLFYCDDTVIPLPDGHRFPHTKYRLLREALGSHPDVPERVLVPSEPATWEQLGRVHTTDYLDSLRLGTLDAAAQRRLGFPWSEALIMRSRRSVGGSVAAAHWALQHRFAANLAGGTHHAFAGHGEGYCVFNDVATAIRDLQVTNPELRAAIIDLDVHQGNGSAAIFEDDPQVFTFSMHGRRNFPFRKQRSTLDVELEDGCDDETYIALLDRAMPKVLQFAPDIAFYIAGADVLDADTLGLLNVTIAGIEARDQRVLDALDSRAIPVVMVMGGGYSRPIERTVEAHTLSYAQFTRRALQVRT